MGDVLAGIHSSWEFDTDSVLIRFERGLRTPKLFHVLGERRIPYEALRAIETAPGAKRGTVELRATPRRGADPLIEAADGQLRDAADPYRLVLPAEREGLAMHHRDLVNAALPADAELTTTGFLVDAPPIPRSFKAYDGKVSFDGATVSFRWFWTGASSAKWKAGDQFFAIEELTGVEWRSPEISGGHLRVRRHGSPEPDSTLSDEHVPADEDPTAVVFGPGCGLVHESLPVAAAVLAALQKASGDPADGGRRSGGAEPHPSAADVATRIRHLGELHAEGLLTDEEFSTKKRDLLTQL